MLTAVLPTRDRADYCACQLRFLRDSGFDYPIIVLDASDDDQAACRAAVPELSAQIVCRHIAQARVRSAPRLDPV